ncbi:hypothetical protein DIZ27_39845 [Streptomyces sp. NWU339]|nr:hypothetical protein DIZ27_39845 [Streptomyces sp. NWU339]
MIGGMQYIDRQLSELFIQYVVVFTQVLRQHFQAWIVLAQMVYPLGKHNRSSPADFIVGC